MIGLIKKDLFMIWANSRRIIILLFIILVLSIQSGVMAAIVPMLSVMLFISSTFSYDEYNKWDAYAITLPNGRKNVVKSKYAVTLLLAAAAVMVSAAVSAVSGFLAEQSVVQFVLETIFTSCIFVVIAVSLLYPLIFRWGSQKGRMVMYIGTFLFSSLMGVLSSFVDFKSVQLPDFLAAMFRDGYWEIPLLLVLLAMLYGSYLISEKIYEKKEF